MQNAFQLQSPVAQRGIQSFGLAPTASMINASLTQHNLTFPRASQGFEANTMSLEHALPTQEQQSLQDASPGRSLPTRNVTNETLDHAYIQFAFYCNPAISSNADTSELNRGFRSPPRSDGKSFDTFVLYNLISRLEHKDIKTWSQLVIELGVEIPDPSKNQSTQKLQQYAVRLKRWLHAYHIDAFFKYLLGVSNSYYTEIPGGDKMPTDVQTLRDGVPPEEDLVVRALLPEWRPKRGRRKADEFETESDIPNKRPLHQRSSSAEFIRAFDEQFPASQSTAPWSAQPQEHDPWAAAQVAIAPKTPSTGITPSSGQLSADIGGQQFKFRVNLVDRPTATPTSPYPLSALQRQQSFPMTPSIEDPKSAGPLSISKSPSRSRKRHGPAVSSAWQGSNSGPNSKLRGRPPSNRSVQEGPYSTFPANPSNMEAPTISVGTPTAAMSPSLGRNENESMTGSASAFRQLSHAANGQVAAPDQATVRKPSKLQLQVPEHAGGPVRLATPPTVLINGEGRQAHERRSSADFFGSLDDGSDDGPDEEPEDAGSVDWKRRALLLKRKLQEKEDELKALKRRVLDAVM